MGAEQRKDDSILIRKIIIALQEKRLHLRWQSGEEERKRRAGEERKKEEERRSLEEEEKRRAEEARVSKRLLEVPTPRQVELIGVMTSDGLAWM